MPYLKKKYSVKMQSLLTFFYISAILRECFPISVLLGNLNDPLTPEDECIPRDISEPGTTGKTSLNTKQCTGEGAVGEGK